MLELERGRLRLFLLFMAGAATFHSTSLVMLAFVVHVPAVPGRTLATRGLQLLLLLIVGGALVQTLLVAVADVYENPSP